MNTFETMIHDDKSAIEKQRLLNDLRLVGDEKPLGYLPISTLTGICDVSIEEMKAELEEKGLIVLELTQGDSKVVGGALYAYSREALSHVLQSARPVLERNGWPTEPDEFVRHLKVFAEDPELYNLVMCAFADHRLKKK